MCEFRVNPVRRGSGADPRRIPPACSADDALL